MRLFACITYMVVVTSARVQVMAAWQLDAAAVVDELVVLATDRRLEARMRERPSRLTEIDPLLSAAHTPEQIGLLKDALAELNISRYASPS